MDFTPSPRAAALAERVAAFVRDEVIPLEPRATHADGLPPELLAELRVKAGDAGLFGPQVPAEYSGLGLDLLECCPVFEAAGRSLLGPLALNCAAPDEGNMHLLHLIGAHHGEPQFGSPVSPKTPEAMALNYIDNLDARMEMFAAGYLVAKPIADRIYDRVRPLPNLFFK